MAERPHEPAPDFAAANGWDAEFETYSDYDLPTYVGPSTFMNLPWITDPGGAAPPRRSMSRSSARRSTTPSATARGPASGRGRSARPSTRRGASIRSSSSVDAFDVLNVVDAGDANIVPSWIERAHAMIYRKVREVAETGAVPIILGGDHSITWPAATAIAEVRRPGSIGIVHFDAHADTANDTFGVLASHGTPMRRLIESGAVKGKNFVQVGLRGYWPPAETFAWMQEQGLRWHFMREIEERGAEAVIAQAIDEALDGPDYIYLSLDIDVIDPGMAPGTGTPEPGGMLTREVLRAMRQIALATELVAMDIVEVAPPYDQAETTAMAANRAALEVISALAVRRRDGRSSRFAGVPAAEG